MFFNYLHIQEISCKSCLFITVQFVVQCNSMPSGAAWAYYGKVLVLVSAA